jgi:hypothetical protein
MECKVVTYAKCRCDIVVFSARSWYEFHLLWLLRILQVYLAFTFSSVL